jgi:hypothetical protein
LGGIEIVVSLKKKGGLYLVDVVDGMVDDIGHKKNGKNMQMKSWKPYHTII